MQRVRLIAIGALIALILLALAWSLLSGWWRALPEGLLAASGRIEGDEVVIAPKIAGQVILVNKDKGDLVQPGDLLARLSSDQLQAQLERAREELKYWEHQVYQAKVNLEYNERNVPATISEREARVETMRARQQEAAAHFEKNRLDYHRYQALFARGVIPKRQLDEAQAAYLATQAILEATTKGLAEAQAQLKQARLLLRTIEIRRAEYEAAQAGFKAARASVKEAEANLEDTFIYSPCRGVILTREIEPGEVVNPGTPLFTLVDLDKLYLKVYINEPDIGKIRLGQEARVYVDAFPDKAFKARVFRVAQRAEFTPKYVETREERVKLVFAVELRVENPHGYLKPGMPGDAVIRLKEGVPWQRPR
ncbi:MAG: efflux RND transporter periplasmic adaptor subunit [Deltaproteobacteria bacterium]|nr:efflux RND transporter periplasmic adaptor subunit [Deltaproteobacteria bacterium]MBW1992008.1 efflux RND transporter periplasmic adaptor subunit [Deltaproteobacteria bacterium]